MSHALEAVRLRRLGFHPIVERTNSKMPAEQAWQKLVDRSEAELQRIFEQMSEGGIGTVTHGFIVIDLDVRPDKNGAEALQALEKETVFLPPTLTSRTLSGGKHLFFRIPPGIEIKNSVSRLGPGIDVRGTGGQVVLPPTVIDGKAYSWECNSDTPAGVSPATEMAELPPEWLKLLTQTEEAKAGASPRSAQSSALRQIRQAAEVDFEAGRRSLYMATLSEPSVQGSGGNAVMMKAAFHAKEMSRNFTEALAALSEWNARLASPPWEEHELIRALQNSEASWGAGLDRKDSAPAGDGDALDGVAWVEQMQAYVAKDRKTGTWNIANPLSERGAVIALKMRGVSVDDAKNALKNCDVVMASSIDCDPTQGATFERDGQLVLNNYIPSKIKPVSGNFPVIAEILEFLTCGDSGAKRWLLNWIAFAVQNPARQMRTVPVVYGAQGTGKSLLARALQALIGEENCATVRNEDIKGKFTSHFVSKLFVAVGEIEAGEVTHATSTLKYLTGEPTLVHEAKGSAAFYTPNRIKMMCNSNQTLPVALEGEADTRWVLFKQLLPPAPDYTARMSSLFDQATNHWSEKGISELSAFKHYLLAYSVDAQLARSIYKNDARVSAVEASRSSIEQFVDAVNGSSLDAVWTANVPDYDRASSQFDNMDFSGAPLLTGAAAVYATYRSFCRSSGLQPLGMGRFPGELERYASNWGRHKVNAGIAPTRPWAYLGIPRDRRLRQAYLPIEMRQGSLSLSAPAQAALPLEERRISSQATRALKDQLTPEAMNAIAAAKQVFGSDAEEEIPF